MKFILINREKLKIVLLVIGCWLLVTILAGCQAFARKFVRKQKAEKKEEIVLIPQEYKAEELNKDQLYRQYFLYWKSWQDELIDSLSSLGLNRKKQFDCLNEAIKNLTSLKDLLRQEKQGTLDNYINEMNNLRCDIAKDKYENFIANHLKKAERLKRNIQGDFSFSKIKDYLL